MTRVTGLVIFALLILSTRDMQAQDCSGGTFLVSATALAIYDIATAPASARRYNERHLAIVPQVDPWHGRYGFSASLSFGLSPRTPPPVPHSSPAGARKSPGTAVALSLASTVAPMGAGLAAGNATGAWLFLGGLVIGPSVGHFYAGQVVRGVGTAAL